jgi:hypothetical protein
MSSFIFLFLPLLRSLYLRTEKEKRYNELPTHKTAHLQIAQADTRPKFAKELFSSQHTQAHPPPYKK